MGSHAVFFVAQSFDAHLTGMSFEQMGHVLQISPLDPQKKWPWIFGSCILWAAANSKKGQPKFKNIL